MIELILAVLLIIISVLSYKALSLYRELTTEFDIKNGVVITNKPSDILQTKHGQLGEVFKMKTYGVEYVVLNSLDAIKEAAYEQAENFSDRPDDFGYFFWLTNHRSVSTSNGEYWRWHRRHFMKHMRNAGMGRSLVEPKLKMFVDQFLQHMDISGGKPSDFGPAVNCYVLNITRYLAYGKYYELDDPEFVAIENCIKTFKANVPGQEFQLGGTWFSLLKANPLTKRYQKMNQVKHRLYQLARNIVAERLEDRKNNNHDRNNVLDAYLDEFEKNNLPINYDILESWFPMLWVDTTFESFNSFLYLIASHPNVQRKCQHEIDLVIGQEEPSLHDMTKLVYVNAVIREMRRYMPSVPVSVLRQTRCDATVRSFRIPAKSKFLMNSWPSLRDPNRFNNPDSFDPNNYIGSDGQLLDIELSDGLGYGRRSCPVAALTKQMIFLFLVSILQRFTLSVENSTKNGQFGDSFKTDFFVFAKPHLLCATKRTISRSQA